MEETFETVFTEDFKRIYDIGPGWLSEQSIKAWLKMLKRGRSILEELILDFDEELKSRPDPPCPTCSMRLWEETQGTKNEK